MTFRVLQTLLGSYDLLNVFLLLKKISQPLIFPFFRVLFLATFYKIIQEPFKTLIKWLICLRKFALGWYTMLKLCLLLWATLLRQGRPKSIFHFLVCFTLKINFLEGVSRVTLTRTNVSTDSIFKWGYNLAFNMIKVMSK